MKLPGDLAAFFLSCAASPAAETTRREADLAENAALQALEWAEDPAIHLVPPPHAVDADDVRELLRTAGLRTRGSVHAGPDTIELLQEAAALLREAQRLHMSAASD